MPKYRNILLHHLHYISIKIRPIKTQFPFWNMHLHTVMAKPSSRGKGPLFKRCTCYNGHIADTRSIPREDKVVRNVQGRLWHNFDNMTYVHVLSEEQLIYVQKNTNWQCDSYGRYGTNLDRDNIIYYWYLSVCTRSKKWAVFEGSIVATFFDLSIVLWNWSGCVVLLALHFIIKERPMNERKLIRPPPFLSSTQNIIQEKN